MTEEDHRAVGSELFLAVVGWIDLTERVTEPVRGVPFVHVRRRRMLVAAIAKATRTPVFTIPTTRHQPRRM